MEEPTQPQDQSSQIYSASNIFKAYKNIRTIIRRTVIQRSSRLSDEFQANVFFKREDGQITRTYKIRGAVHKIITLPSENKELGIYCCSAGNLGVAVAFACQHLKVKGLIFVPQTTAPDKLARIREFGKDFIELKLAGMNLSECEKIATAEGEERKMTAIRLDDRTVIEGSGSLGIEILEDFPMKGKIDYLVMPIATGTLGAALACYFQQLSPETEIIGITPSNSDNEMVFEDMAKQMQLDQKTTFAIMKDLPNYKQLDIPEGEAYDQVMQLYNYDGIVLEPHGALAPAALKLLQQKLATTENENSLKGKNIVCILTGRNSAISRMNDIKVLANVHSHRFLYLLVDFFRKPDAIKEFLTKCLAPKDEILQIDYTKKSSREKGPALVGIELADPSTYSDVLDKMSALNISFKVITPKDEIFHLKV